MANIQNNQKGGIIKAFKKDVYTGDIIGLPPSYVYEAANGEGHNYIVLAGTPIMSIQPALPTPTGKEKGESLQLFDLSFTEGWKRYSKILGTVYKDVDAPAYEGLRKLAGETSGSIQVAFQNDASISESFVAEYAESRLEGGLSGISNDLLGEMRYMTGSKGVGESFSKLAPETQWSEAPGGVGETLTYLPKNIAKSLGFLGMKGAGLATGAAGAAAKWATGGAGFEKLAGGSKIDFPQIWRGCGYSPSYSFTIRLYNPYPKSLSAHRTFIIEPLAKLIALIVPVSDSKATFSYPLICAVSCPGLFCIESGYISALDIIKGGDTNAITYNQRPVMVDIKMTISSLYNSMIAHGFDEDGNEINIADKNRPTFRNYIQQLETEAGIPTIVPSGKNLWELTAEKEKELGLPNTNPIVAASTDILSTNRVPVGSTSVYSNLTS